jgi:enoyl-CoA hydratase
MIPDYPGIEISLDGDVARVTLCRPAALNAPDRAMHTALARLWSDLAGRDDVAAVVLTGAGRAFSAGTDRALLRAILDDEAVRAAVIGEASSILLGLLDLPMPTVAAVNGPAVGLGCSLATVCDLVVMAEEAYFVDPHVPIGLAGGDGVALVWPQLTGLLVAKEYALLGRRLEAGRARELGLAHRVVPGGDLLDTAGGLARRLARAPAQAIRETKRVLNSAMRRHLERGLPVAVSAELRSLQIDENRSALERAVEATVA